MEAVVCLSSILNFGGSVDSVCHTFSIVLIILMLFSFVSSHSNATSSISFSARDAIDVNLSFAMKLLMIKA